MQLEPLSFIACNMALWLTPRKEVETLCSGRCCWTSLACPGDTCAAAFTQMYRGGEHGMGIRAALGPKKDVSL